MPVPFQTSAATRRRRRPSGSRRPRLPTLVAAAAAAAALAAAAASASGVALALGQTREGGLNRFVVLWPLLGLDLAVSLGGLSHIQAWKRPAQIWETGPTSGLTQWSAGSLLGFNPRAPFGSHQIRPTTDRRRGSGGLGRDLA